MDILICVAALAVLILLAYRGVSVILAAPLVAMGAVLLIDPAAVPAAFSGLYMEKLGIFVKTYLPLFLLGALFGKLIEVSGAAYAIVNAITRRFGPRHAIVAIAIVGMILTYGGVSVFVVVFAVYPFAAEMFRQADIPKRLIPAAIALSAFTVTMDAFPGTPQIQNIIPTAVFGTNAYAAPFLGLAAGLFTGGLALAYLLWRQRSASAAGEGYGDHVLNEPDAKLDSGRPAMPLALALLPLICVGLGNRVFLEVLENSFGETASAVLNPAMAAAPISLALKANAAVWAVEAALIVGILVTAAIGWKAVRERFAGASQAAVGGALLAALNTASEYGFGAVVAVLPGFLKIADSLSKISNPLLNEAVTINILCAITGSASGGLSLTLAAFGDRFIAAAQSQGIPMEVMHRIASLASGGMDTLPHNGAVITLLAVTGLTHRQAYKDIFAITVIKTVATFVAIGLFYATGLV